LYDEVEKNLHVWTYVVENKNKTQMIFNSNYIYIYPLYKRFDIKKWR